ncbi:MAG: DUF1963 domain-containing protein [Armatimonadetes bacterium]|nr:DUF1963 domain-containing protein [Armatimonadota bacterium]
MPLKQQLPAELEPFRAKIEKSLRPFVQIRPVPGSEPNLWSSRFGGWPYLTAVDAYPFRADGAPLYLLAQLNFEELPALDRWPRQGLLQLFVSDDDLHGLDLDEPLEQTGFQVRYYPEIRSSALVEEFGFVPDPDMLPISEGCALAFHRREGPVTLTDFRAEALLPEILESDELYELYEGTFPSGGHRLGGYPFFTQQDLRSYGQHLRDYELLLQMDTDDEVGMMWGDCGVGNFFIRPADLERRDFSRVIYNWDCC